MTPFFPPPTRGLKRSAPFDPTPRAPGGFFGPKVFPRGAKPSSPGGLRAKAERVLAPRGDGRGKRGPPFGGGAPALLGCPFWGVSGARGLGPAPPGRWGSGAPPLGPEPRGGVPPGPPRGPAPFTPPNRGKTRGVPPGIAWGFGGFSPCLGGKGGGPGAPLGGPLGGLGF